MQSGIELDSNQQNRLLGLHSIFLLIDHSIPLQEPEPQKDPEMADADDFYEDTSLW